MSFDFIEGLLQTLTDRTRPTLLWEMDGPRARPIPPQQVASTIGQLRGALRREGISPGDRVALIAPNSASWVMIDLAVLAEGAVTVPLYARQPAEALAAQARDADPALVVTTQDLLPALEAALWDTSLATRVRNLSTLRTSPALPNFAAPATRGADEVVTLLYTSGTSGAAKGVMLTRENCEFMLARTRTGLAKLLPAQPGTRRVFHYLPLCFAGSRILLWTCLLEGTPIWLSLNLDALQTELTGAKPHLMLNVPFLLERIRRGVEGKLLAQSPALHRLFLATFRAHLRHHDGTAQLGDKLLVTVARRTLLAVIRKQVGAHFRALLCGSAPLSRETQLWFDLIGIPVYQIYGLTETTAIVTMDEPGHALPGYVGAPIADIEVKTTPEGELLVRGPNISPGYFRQAQATRDVFVEGGWFRTGDLVERGPDSRLKVVGRCKNLLVASSGHNIAPEPIEEALREHIPGAEHVVVIGHGRPFLTAIITGDCSEDAVQRAVATLNSKLPHYQRIRHHQLVSERLTVEQGLLTANQKLRRDAVERYFCAALDAIYHAESSPSPSLGQGHGTGRAALQATARGAVSSNAREIHD